MARRRKAGRKPVPQQHRTFAQLMPKPEFNFGAENVLLDYVNKTEIRHALKWVTLTMDRNKIDEALGDLVRGGVSLINEVGNMSPPDFWGRIRTHIRWAQDLPPPVVSDLIIVLIRAHEDFEMNPTPGCPPENYGPAAKMIGQFTRLLREKYEQNPGVMNAYFPSFAETLDGYDDGYDTDESIPLSESDIKYIKEDQELGAKLDNYATHKRDNKGQSSGSRQEPENLGYDYAIESLKHIGAGYSIPDDNKLTGENEEEMLRQQLQLLDEARARHAGNGGAIASGSNTANNALQGAGEQPEEGYDAEAVSLGKRFRDENEDEEMADAPSTISDSKRRCSHEVENDPAMNGLAEDMRGAGL